MRFATGFDRDVLSKTIGSPVDVTIGEATGMTLSTMEDFLAAAMNINLNTSSERLQLVSGSDSFTIMRTNGIDSSMSIDTPLFAAINGGGTSLAVAPLSRGGVVSRTYSESNAHHFARYIPSTDTRVTSSIEVFTHTNAEGKQLWGTKDGELVRVKGHQCMVHDPSGDQRPVSLFIKMMDNGNIRIESTIVHYISDRVQQAHHTMEMASNGDRFMESTFSLYKNTGTVEVENYAKGMARLKNRKLTLAYKVKAPFREMPVDVGFCNLYVSGLTTDVEGEGNIRVNLLRLRRTEHMFRAFQTNHKMKVFHRNRTIREVENGSCTDTKMTVDIRKGGYTAVAEEDKRNTWWLPQLGPGDNPRGTTRWTTSFRAEANTAEGWGVYARNDPYSYGISMQHPQMYAAGQSADMLMRGNHVQVDTLYCTYLTTLWMSPADVCNNHMGPSWIPTTENEWGRLEDEDFVMPAMVKAVPGGLSRTGLPWLASINMTLSLSAASHHAHLVAPNQHAATVAQWKQLEDIAKELYPVIGFVEQFVTSGEYDYRKLLAFARDQIANCEDTETLLNVPLVNGTGRLFDGNYISQEMVLTNFSDATIPEKTTSLMHRFGCGPSPRSSWEFFDRQLEDAIPVSVTAPGMFSEFEEEMVFI
jgi:hypothetical protein